MFPFEMKIKIRCSVQGPSSDAEQFALNQFLTDDNLSQSSQHCQMVGFELVLNKCDLEGSVLR